MIGDILTCPICGKTFAKQQGMQKYCSNECSLESVRRRAREYHERHKTERPRKPRKVTKVDRDEMARRAVAALNEEQKCNLICLLASEKEWAKVRRERGWDL